MMPVCPAKFLLLCTIMETTIQSLKGNTKFLHCGIFILTSLKTEFDDNASIDDQQLPLLKLRAGNSRYIWCFLCSVNITPTIM